MPARRWRSSIRPDRGDPHGADLRGGARGLQLHLRRGDLVARAWPTGSASHVRAFAFFDGVPEHSGPGQSAQRRHQGASLRAGSQSHLPRNGHPLRRGGRAGAGAQAARQGQGRRPACRSSSAGSWRACATRRSSVLSDAEHGDRAPCWNGSISGPSRNCPVRDARPSRRSIVRRCKPSRPTPYVFAEWKQARVNIDYHVEVDGHYYSVPYTLVKQALDVRLTGTRSSASTTASASPAMCARREGPPHHRRRAHAQGAIASSPSGPRSAWCAGPSRPDRPPPGSSATSSPTVRIPSRASAPVWGSCAWASVTVTTAWRPPVRGRCV